MRTVTFPDAATAQAYGAQVDSLMGYPSVQSPAPGAQGIIPPPSPSPPGPWWTERNRFAIGSTYEVDGAIETALLTRQVSEAERAAVSGPIVAQGVKMRIVPVSDFGAKGDGSTDDTNAIKAAIANAGTNGLIVFEAKNTAYRVRCGEIVFNSCRVTGSLSHPITLTRIKALDAGPWVVRIAGAAVVNELMIDARVDATPTSLRATNAVFVDIAHASRITRVHAEGAADYAWDIQRTTAPFGDLVAQSSGRGFRVQGCNGSEFRRCLALFNNGRGWYVSKSPSDPEGGECRMVGSWADSNNLTQDAEAVLIDGIDGFGWYDGGYIEGNSSNPNPADFVITGGTHNVNLSGLHFVGPQLRLKGNARAVTIHGCRAPGAGPHMHIEADGGIIPRDINVVGCFQTSSADSQPWIVRWTDGATTFDAVALDGWQAHGPPTIGWWRQGQRVWNRSPVVGEPMGWTQFNAPGGQPGTWLPMPVL